MYVCISLQLQQIDVIIEVLLWYALDANSIRHSRELQF